MRAEIQPLPPPPSPDVVITLSYYEAFILKHLLSCDGDCEFTTPPQRDNLSHELAAALDKAGVHLPRN